MWTILFTSTALADCAVSSADLTRTVEDAEVAFGRLDLAGFRTATDRVDADVRCLSDIVSPSLAARLHRTEGLRAWVEGDKERARAGFAAARSIEPEFLFPAAVVPAGHPVRDQYELSDPTTGALTPLPPPADGQLWLDGRIAEQRPEERAALTQLSARSGRVRASALLWPGEPVFPYDVQKPETKGPNLALSIIAGASLAVGGLTYALAVESNDRFEDPATTADALPGLRDTTNALFFTSLGAGVVALGSGVGAVVAGSW